MSVKAMALVWERSNQSGSDLLLLLAIADYAKDDGTGAWPSHATLAKKTRMTRGNVIRRLQRLEAAGELAILKGAGPHGVNLYSVSPPSSVDATCSAEATGGVAPKLQEGVAPALQNPSSYPSFNHHAPPLEKSSGGEGGGAPPKGATRDEGYLPTAEVQMGMLIPQAARVDKEHTEALTAIERSSWRIGGDAKDALVEFMSATHLGIPRPTSVRKDWTDALTYHAHEYGVSRLKTLYPSAVQYMRDRDLTYTRPASLDTALAKVAAEAKTAQPKQVFEMEWKHGNPF